MIPRLIEKAVLKNLFSLKKITVILGARQVGKTTLLKNIRQKLEKDQKNVLYIDCDTEESRRTIDTTSLTLLSKLVKNTDYLFIDEAQRLQNPGLTLKILYDNIKNLKIIATGSSSFDLKNKLSDALTGRYLDFILYPFSFSEAVSTLNLSSNTQLRRQQADSLLEETMLYGLYPEIFLTAKSEDKALLLEKIVESYLFKDIFAFQKVRYPQAIKDLTRALAYQIGAEINENELASRIKIDRKTVVNYLNILEQSFVILRLFPYSQNPRREIGKRYKIYFADTGIRNALIGDFNPVNVRADLGSLWENFLIVERIKSFANLGRTVRYHFWRAYGGAEIDYLEKSTRAKTMRAFEIKHGRQKLGRGAKLFSKKYHIPISLVNKENYLQFILAKKQFGRK